MKDTTQMVFNETELTTVARERSNEEIGSV